MFRRFGGNRGGFRGGRDRFSGSSSSGQGSEFHHRSSYGNSRGRGGGYFRGRRPGRGQFQPSANRFSDGEQLPNYSGNRFRQPHAVNEDVLDTSHDRNLDSLSGNDTDKNSQHYYKSPMRTPSKMGRIIIRNLPFSTSEDDLRKLMEKCGKITEVRIPLKDDGKMRGFAFVQFQSINSAETAVKKFNASEFKNRPIAVDWAVAKSRYDAAKSQPLPDKLSEEDAVADEAEDEMNDTDDSKEGETKEDNEAEESSTEDEKSDSEKDSDEDDEDDSEEAESEEGSDVEGSEDGIKKKKPRHPKKPNDVEEGKTVFVRNIPFDVLEEEFREFFLQFGKTKYALLCMNKDSGHSKGSGFVKFFSKDSADSCIAKAASGEVTLKQRKLNICIAETGKQRRKSERTLHEKPKKDNRNLRLLKANREADHAPDPSTMSESDAKKRSLLDKRKAEALKNLHKFLSTTRLSIHNIPKNIDDKQLKKIILETSGVKYSHIKKCRIMRDMQQLNAKKMGKSKGFAFVDFDDHESALRTLKTLDNNPDVFHKDRRPIVEFSLENKAALLKKQKRLEHSQAKMKILGKDAIVSAKNDKKKPVKSRERKPTADTQTQSQPKNLSSKKTSKNIPKESSPKESEPKKSKKPAKEKKRKLDEPKEETDDFSKVVENYRNKLMKSAKNASAKGARWFDE